MNRKVNVNISKFKTILPPPPPPLEQLTAPPSPLSPEGMRRGTVAMPKKAAPVPASAPAPMPTPAAAAAAALPQFGQVSGKWNGFKSAS